MALSVTLILALEDNYIYLLESEGSVAIIDPAVAEPAQEVLTRKKISLSTILITHHHSDHVGGVLELKDAHDANVFGPEDERVPGLDHPLKEGDAVRVGSCEFHVLSVPAHTSTHIAYYAPKERKLFCGDCLFTAGCGRLFEGTPEQMYSSLQKLAKLPADTQVYCGHEYTVKNLNFAVQIEPGNRAVADRLRQAEQWRAEGRPTIPALLSLELQTNPFLRAHTPELKAALNMAQATDQEVFTHLRTLRNSF